MRCCDIYGGLRVYAAFRTDIDAKNSTGIQEYVKVTTHFFPVIEGILTSRMGNLDCS